MASRPQRQVGDTERWIRSHKGRAISSVAGGSGAALLLVQAYMDHTELGKVQERQRSHRARIELVEKALDHSQREIVDLQNTVRRLER